MPHQPTRGGILEMLSVRALLFYFTITLVAVLLGAYLYDYITTPLVRFEDYGVSLQHKVPVTGYNERIIDEPKGRAAIVEIGLPANIALEEAKASMVAAMADLYKRRPDVDVIILTSFYEHYFGHGSYFSVGTAVWGNNGHSAPVIHMRNKSGYRVSFSWRVSLPTTDERTLAESKRKAKEEAASPSQ